MEPLFGGRTVARLNAVVAAKDMKVFAVINHSDRLTKQGSIYPRPRSSSSGIPKRGRQ